MDQTYLKKLEQRIRSRAPVSSYGYLDYLLDPLIPVYFEKGDLHLKTELDFSRGYNCGDICNLISEEMTKDNQEVEIYEGEDSKGNFSRHFYCVDKEKRIIDGTPLYAFTGERHPKGEISELDKDTSNPTLQNPLQVHSNKYIIQVSFENYELFKGLSQWEGSKFTFFWLQKKLHPDI